MNVERLSFLIEKAATASWPEALSFIAEWCRSPYYHLLYLLSVDMSPCIAVELGVEKGRGMGSLAAGSGLNWVFGIDVHRPPELEVLLATFPNTTFFQGPVGPAPRGFPEGIDILHVDASHSYGAAKNDFGAYEQYLNPGAVICFDDLTAMEGGVARAFNEFSYPKIRDDRLHPICGYGVMIYE